VKLKMETGSGWLVVDDIGEARYKRLKFETPEELTEYIALRFEYREDYEVLLVDEAGEEADYAPEVMRISAKLRNEEEKSFFVNARAFLLNDDNGGTIDVIPAGKRCTATPVA